VIAREALLVALARRIYGHAPQQHAVEFTGPQPLLIDMPTLHAKDSGQLIGRISDSDLQFLMDQLEEESSDDRDYYIDEATIEMLEEDGASAALVALLRSAVADHSEGLDIVWTPD
jgi:hypothetical protein